MDANNYTHEMIVQSVTN